MPDERGDRPKKFKHIILQEKKQVQSVQKWWHYKPFLMIRCANVLTSLKAIIFTLEELNDRTEQIHTITVAFILYTRFNNIGNGPTCGCANWKTWRLIT